MTLFGGSGLIVSLPGAELVDVDLPGSVVAPHAVLAAAISPELRSALLLVRDEGLRLGLPVICIARPELFTHGAALDWLRARMEGITTHLCLSDGSSIKTLAGCRTLVFFHRRADSAPALARRILGRRAPELMARIDGQVNSHFVLGHGAHQPRPPAHILCRAAPLDQPRATLWPFFFNRDSAEDTAHTIARAGPVIPHGLAGFTELRYLPLTSAALDARGFARAVAEHVLQACFDPALLLVLRLPAGQADPDRGPPDRSGRGALGEGIAAILPALRDSGILIPRAMPPNIVFAAGDIAETHELFDRAALHIVVHESFDFWRHSAGFYARAAQVSVLADRDAATPPGFLPDDLAALYGPRATLIPLESPDAA